MLLIDIFKYLFGRARKREIFLKTHVDRDHDHFGLTEEPSIAIVIPTKDKVELLRPCIESITSKTLYDNYQIIVVDNQSSEVETHKYLSELRAAGVRVLSYPKKFNYSAICNFAAAQTAAEYLCLLNNDTEVVSPDWLRSLVDHAETANTGVVGALMVYGDSTIQHNGIVLGIRGVGHHVDRGSVIDASKTESSNLSCREISAVTFACALISSDIFSKSRGLDESFVVGLNDVDFCSRLLMAGYSNVICTKAILIHHESRSRQNPFSIKGFGRAAIETVRYLARYPGQKDEFYFDR